MLGRQSLGRLGCLADQDQVPASLLGAGGPRELRGQRVGERWFSIRSLGSISRRRENRFLVRQQGQMSNQGSTMTLSFPSWSHIPKYWVGSFFVSVVLPGLSQWFPKENFCLSSCVSVVCSGLLLSRTPSLCYTPPLFFYSFTCWWTFELSPIFGSYD